MSVTATWPTTQGGQFALGGHDLPYVLFFYPKDNTPGCTTEANDFKAVYAEIQQLGYQVYGISRDSIKSHENFKLKFELPFELISDPEEQLCLHFEVMKQKMMYGKQVRGIERSTFIMSANGEILQAYRGVKVPGHVETVMQFLRGNTSTS